MNNQTNLSEINRQKRIRRLLYKLALVSSVLIAGTGIQAQTTNFYGDQALNPSIQPNVLNEGRVHFNYYGSGDANGDGVIDYQDYLAMQNNVSNDRTDLNGDGVTDSLDLELMNQFLTGQIKYLPAHWDLLQTETERIDWLEKTLAIDSTSNIFWDLSWNCTNFANQTVMNLSGIENISGSGFNFGTNPYAGQYDSTKNARFNIPSYFVTTKTTNNESHAINAVLIGDSATNFSDWYFLEPQLDSRVYPGNLSMDPNSYAYLQRSAYGYSPIFQQFMYGNQQGPVKFTLNNGNDSLIWTNPYAVLTRTPVPLEPTNEIIPNDTIIQLGNPTDTSATGYVSNISNGAHVNYTDSLHTINADNYDIYRTFSWKPFHKYIDSSAPTTVLYEYPWTWLNIDSLGTQKIEVRDTQSPTVVSVPNPLNINYGDSIPNLEEVVFSDNSNVPLNIVYTDSITQNPDIFHAGHYNYEIWKNARATDLSGNFKDTTYLYAQIRTIPIVITGISQPYQVVFGDSVPQPQINFTGTPALPVTINLTDSTTQSTNPDSCSYFNYEQWIKAELTDISGNKTDTTFKNADIYKPHTTLVFTFVPKDTVVSKEFQVTQAALDGLIQAEDTLYKTSSISFAHDTTLIWSSLFEEQYDIITTVTGSCGCSRDTNWRLIKWLGYSTEDIYKTEAAFMLYPVPAGNLLNIEAENIEQGLVHWEIYNTQGSLKAAGSFTHNAAHPQAIPLEVLAAGVYILKIHTSKASYTRRFVKGL